MDQLREYLKTHAVDDLVHQAVLDEATRRFLQFPHIVEEAALRAGLLPARYQRNRKTLSIEQQLGLFQSRVAVIGGGGLGGYVIEGLARLGVGTIVTVDPDQFEEHNLNRQILCTLETLGYSKTAAAAHRVQKINPAITMIAVQKALNYDNGGEFLKECDAVVDALDSNAARIELARFCSDHSLSLVHGAIAGWYGQIAVQLPGQQTVLTLLQKCKEKAGIEKEIGNPAFAPMVVAGLQTAEVCKIITQRDRTLSGRIIFIDLLDMRFEEMKLE
jgi:molybdopterin/thiamine biosynthesis adenylyltransferase